MGIVRKCDICGETFDYGFSVDVNIQGGMSWTNVSEDRFEIKRNDICKSCYYKVKKIVTDEIKSDKN